MALLEKLGVRADGIASFFEQMMEKEPKDSGRTAGVWSSHPPTAERIAATRRPASGKARLQRRPVEGAAQCLQVSAARRPSAQRQMRSG